MTLFNTPIQIPGNFDGCSNGSTPVNFPKSTEKQFLEKVQKDKDLRLMNQTSSIIVSELQKEQQSLNNNLEQAQQDFLKNKESINVKSETLADQQKNIWIKEQEKSKIPLIDQSIEKIDAELRKRAEEQRVTIRQQAVQLETLFERYQELYSQLESIQGQQQAVLAEQQKVLQETSDYSPQDNIFITALLNKNKNLFRELSSKSTNLTEDLSAFVKNLNKNLTLNITHEEMLYLQQILGKKSFSSGFSQSSGQLNLTFLRSQRDKEARQKELTVVKATIFQRLVLLYPDLTSLVVSELALQAFNRGLTTSYNTIYTVQSISKDYLDYNKVTREDELSATGKKVLAIVKEIDTAPELALDLFISSNSVNSPIKYLDILTVGTLVKIKQFLHAHRGVIQAVLTNQINKSLRERLFTVQQLQRDINEDSAVQQQYDKFQQNKKTSISLSQSNASNLVSRINLDLFNKIKLDITSVNSLLGLVKDSNSLTVIPIIGQNNLRPARTQTNVSPQRIARNKPDTHLISTKNALEKNLGLEQKIKLQDLPIGGNLVDKDLFKNLLSLGATVENLNGNSIGTRNVRRELIEFEFDLNPLDINGKQKPANQITRVRMPFYINPDKFSFNKNKNVAETFTRGGWSYTHWGERPPTIELSGTTGRASMLGIQALDFFYDVSGRSYYEIQDLFPESGDVDRQFYDNLRLVKMLAPSTAIPDALTGTFKSYRDSVPTFLTRSPIGNTFNDQLRKLESKTLQEQKQTSLFSGVEKLTRQTLGGVGRVVDNLNMLTQAAATWGNGVYKAPSDFANSVSRADTSNAVCLVAGAINNLSRLAPAQFIANTTTAVRQIQNVANRMGEDNKLQKAFEQQKKLQELDNKSRQLIADFRDKYLSEEFQADRRDLKYGLQSTVRIRMYFEDVIYIGHIKTFTYNRVAEKPLVTYNMTFTVEEMIRMPVSIAPQHLKPNGRVGVGVVGVENAPGSLNSVTTAEAQRWMDFLIQNYGFEEIDRFRLKDGRVDLRQVYQEAQLNAPISGGLTRDVDIVPDRTPARDHQSALQQAQSFLNPYQPDYHGRKAFPGFSNGFPGG